MRKYRFIPGAGVLALALIAMMNEDVPAVIGLILIIAAAILLIFASRGTVYFSKAVRAINSSEPGKKEKGVELMEKALKAGLSDENAVVAASVLLQNDNEEKAKEILEPLSMSKERKVAGPALSSLSMYYWLQRDYAKAIELCEKSKSIGYVSRNLCINLLTYYLAAGKTREFSELLDEMGTSGGSSPAIVDFVAVNAMFHGQWKQAGAYLEALCSEARPNFPDAYVHFAQVYMHYGDVKNARRLFSEALDADFARYSVYTKETVKEMLNLLNDKQCCRPFIEAANRDNKAILKIVNGTIPNFEKAETDEEIPDVLPGFPALPDFSEVISNEEEDDDREANTELTEADERWLKRHED